MRPVWATWVKIRLLNSACLLSTPRRFWKFRKLHHHTAVLHVLLSYCLPYPLSSILPIASRQAHSRHMCPCGDCLCPLPTADPGAYFENLTMRWSDDVFNRLFLGRPIVPYGSYFLFPGGEGTELVDFGLDVGL